MQLEDMVAVVTGGNKGIGRATSLRLAEEGADLVIAARDAAAAEEVLAEARDMGRQALAVATDVTQRDQVERMIAQAMETFGHIDILVNCAGQLFQEPAVSTDPDRWENLINVNLRGTFLCCHAVLPHMLRQEGGKIVNISSTAGKWGAPGACAYSASKFAVSGLSDSMDQELAEKGIGVSAVCPGMVLTDKGRSALPGVDTSTWLKPEDIADIVLFLVTRPAHVLIPEVLVLASELDYFRQ